MILSPIILSFFLGAPFRQSATSINLSLRQTHLIRPPNLPPYLPLASRVNPLLLNDLESQRAFLLATPLLLETNAYETDN